MKIKVEDFHLLYDNIFVRGIRIEEADGIMIPSQYDDKPELGEVINIGKGRLLDDGTIVPLEIKKGDTVYFNKYSTTKFNVDGDDYYVIREEDIVGYIR